MSDLSYTKRDELILRAWVRELRTDPDPALTPLVPRPQEVALP